MNNIVPQLIAGESMEETRTTNINTELNSKKYLGVEDLARLLGVCTRIIHRMHSTGQLPPGKRLGRRILRWSAETIDKWFAKAPTR